VGPAGAKPLADGPAVGARVTRLSGTLLLDRSPWQAKFPRTGDLLLVFVSPQCETCNSLIPHVTDFLRHHRAIDVQLISTIDDVPLNRAYVAYKKIKSLPYVLGEEMARELDIQGVPYGLRIDRGGVVRAKGIVNNFENLVLLSRQDQLPTDNVSSDHPDRRLNSSAINAGETDEVVVARA
jgi:hypothetical protein